MDDNSAEKNKNENNQRLFHDEKISERAQWENANFSYPFIAMARRMASNLSKYLT